MRSDSFYIAIVQYLGLAASIFLIVFAMGASYEQQHSGEPPMTVQQ